MCGTGRFSTSLERAKTVGEALRHDIIINSAHNLCDRKYVNWVKELLAAHVIDVLHIGLECRTHSRAAHPPYRTSLCPMGLSGLPQHKADILAEANTYTLACYEILIFAHDHAPWVLASLENPGKSICWRIEPMPAWLLGAANGDGTHYDCVTHYCRFGMPWQKATRVVSTYSLSRLAKPCTHKLHKEKLQGSVKIGNKWVRRTLLACPYPWPMLRLWNSIIAEKLTGTGR